MTNKALVKDYMTKNVISVPPETPNTEIIELMKKTGHDGFPVTDSKGCVRDMITAYDLLLKNWSQTINEIMSKDVVMAQQDMSINDASRVMFRMGVSKLPVINKRGALVGIITNTDIIRSSIERTTPTKVNHFKNTLEQLYGVKATIRREKVKTESLRPTQDKVYADELQGRTYELKRGLAEPTIVVKSGERYILIDGHHRTVAALQLGCKEIDSYIIDLHKDMVLGVEKTADMNGIREFKDIEIIDDDHHPLIALTEPMQKRRDE